jgi:pimeloyl-ACP methyl ester carboxylesterase
MISPGFSTGPTDAATKRYTEEIGRIAVVEDKGIVFRRWLEYVVSPSAPLFAKARYRSILDRTPTETLVNYLVNNKIAPRPDLPGKLKCPVFLPVGADDSVVDMDGPLGQIADLHITKLESAGRLPPLEAPAAFNAALRAFWAGLGD